MAPRGYLVPTRASSLMNQTVLGCAWARPWKKVYTWPHPFSARGAFPGNAEDTAGHSSSYIVLSAHTHADDPPQIGATPTSSYAYAHARPISKKWSGQNRTGRTGPVQYSPANHGILYSRIQQLVGCTEMSIYM